MAKWIPDAHLDLVLEAITVSDEEVVLTQQPTTYYNCVWPVVWSSDTSVIEGDLVYPPTQNGFIYECVTAGSTGSSEPGWSVTQDETFSDGTVIWKAHENYSLANQSLDPADKVISDGDIDGRKLTISQKMGVTTHTSGVVAYFALIEHATKSLHYVTTSETTTPGDNSVNAGRTTIFYEHTITVRDIQ